MVSCRMLSGTTYVDVGVINRDVLHVTACPATTRVGVSDQTREAMPVRARELDPVVNAGNTTGCNA